MADSNVLRTVRIFRTLAEFRCWHGTNVAPAPSFCVVIDVLRATSSAVHALACGASSMALAESPSSAVEEVTQLLPQGDVILAGSCQGGAPVGLRDFAAPPLAEAGARLRCSVLGNSPALFTPTAVRGKSIVFTTTNGVKALVAAGEWCSRERPAAAVSGADSSRKVLQRGFVRGSDSIERRLRGVIVCSLLNVSAVAKTVHHGLQSSDSIACDATYDLAVICSGGSEADAEEDLLCGGALLSLLLPLCSPVQTTISTRKATNFEAWVAASWLRVSGGCFDALTLWAEAVRDAHVALMHVSSPSSYGSEASSGLLSLPRWEGSLFDDTLIRLLAAAVGHDAGCDLPSSSISLPAGAVVDFASLQTLKASLHGQRLAAGGFAQDVYDCSAVDRFSVVPLFEGGVISL